MRISLKQLQQSLFALGLGVCFFPDVLLANMDDESNVNPEMDVRSWLSILESSC